MKSILFSVSYAGFWGQDNLSLEQFIARAGALGYDGVEIMGKRPHAFPADMTQERVRRINDLLREHHLEMACMAAYTNFTAGAQSREVPLVDMQVEYVGELCRITRDLGGDLVRIFTGYEVAGQDYISQWKQCVNAVQACCDRAADYGVRIGIQNHHDIAVDSRDMLEFLREVERPNAYPMFDAWSPALRGENLTTTAKQMATQSVYTTVADYIRIPRYQYQPDLINYQASGPDLIRAVPMGEGDIDYVTFLQCLLEAGYRGPVCYEMCSPLRGGGSLANLDACASRFIRFMRENGFAEAA
jgi:sugar phosphate isomerase/epimerase